LTGETGTIAQGRWFRPGSPPRTRPLSTVPPGSDAAPRRPRRSYPPPGCGVPTGMTLPDSREGIPLSPSYRAGPGPGVGRPEFRTLLRRSAPDERLRWGLQAPAAEVPQDDGGRFRALEGRRRTREPPRRRGPHNDESPCRTCGFMPRGRPRPMGKAQLPTSGIRLGLQAPAVEVPQDDGDRFRSFEGPLRTREPPRGRGPHNDEARCRTSGFMPRGRPRPMQTMVRVRWTPGPQGIRRREAPDRSGAGQERTDPLAHLFRGEF